MRVTLFAAMSLDGFIADTHGKEDFLSDAHWHALCRLAKKAGAMVLGRKAFDTVRGWKAIGFKDIPTVRKIVLSRQDRKTSIPHTHFVKTPAQAIAVARKAGFKQIILAGGASTYSQFFDQRLVTDAVIRIEPVLLGKGVSLLDPAGKRSIVLKKIRTAMKSDGIHELIFKI